MEIKPRIIQSYHQIPQELKDQIKLVFPKGFRNHLRLYKNLNGEYKLGLIVETNLYVYNIEMDNKMAASILQTDRSYNKGGLLKKKAKSLLQMEYGSDPIIVHLNPNEDNSTFLKNK